MNVNRNATLKDLFRAIDKNNDELLKNIPSNGSGGSFSISSKENNAIINEEDGAYVTDYKKDIDTIKQSISLLNENSIIGQSNDFFFMTDSNNDRKYNGGTVNKDSFLNSFNRSVFYNNNISISNDGYVKLPPYKKFKIHILIFSNSSDIEFHLYDRNKTCITGNSGYTSKSGYNTGSSIFFIETTDEEIEFNVIASSSFSFWSEYSYILIEEVGRTVIIDPLEEIQGYELDEVLFESETPKNSGNIQLSKDFTEYDYLYFELGVKSSNNFMVITTNEIKVDKLTVSSSNNTIDLHGLGDCDVEIYKATNSSFTIRTSKTYGITRIIGKKSKNPVLLNNNTNVCGYRTITLFDGVANATGIIYNLIDDFTKYDSIKIYHRLNETQGMKNVFEIATKDIELNKAIFDLSCMTNTSAYYSIRLKFTSNNSFKIDEKYTASDWGSHSSSIYRIEGISSDGSTSKTEEELEECLTEIWAEEE